jgi:hypothetical protein
MRAEISVPDFPSLAHAGEELRVKVHLKNRGDSVWAGCERNAGPLQVSLGGHWLNSSGQAIAAGGGRTVLAADLAPSQETDLIYTVDAPSMPGEYVLELDMLQEGVAWFGLKSSKTWRGNITVK